MTVATPLPSLSDVSPAEWKALAGRRIFFGHQSVGNNILSGLDSVLAAHPEIQLHVVQSSDLGPRGTPGFYHARVGRNRYPGEKSDAFVQIAKSSLAEPGSIGMVKFCYVDVVKDSDPQALFDDYQRKMAELGERTPDLTVVHFTMPLVADEGTLEYWKNRVRREETERSRNIVRNRYNNLLRRAYWGREPIFDIAALESTRADGSRAFFRSGGETFFVVAPEYTSDGGHLNDLGARRVAEQLLILLAKLPHS